MIIIVVVVVVVDDIKVGRDEIRTSDWGVPEFGNALESYEGFDW